MFHAVQNTRLWTKSRNPARLIDITPMYAHVICKIYYKFSAYISSQLLVNVYDLQGDLTQRNLYTHEVKHWKTNTMHKYNHYQLQTYKCQYYTADTSVIKNASTCYCLWCMYSYVHTNIYFWILWSKRGSSPEKLVVHYYLKLKAHVCLCHKNFKHFYTLQCAAVCTVYESVKIICNIHYIVYAFVGVISNTALMHRMNNSKTVILNL